MSGTGIQLQGYTFYIIRDHMVERFCAQGPTLGNPACRVSGQGRTSAVLEHGEIESSIGDWADCSETREDGFLAKSDGGCLTYDGE